MYRALSFIGIKAIYVSVSSFVILFTGFMEDMNLRSCEINHSLTIKPIEQRKHSIHRNSVRPRQEQVTILNRSCEVSSFHISINRQCVSSGTSSRVKTDTRLVSSACHRQLFKDWASNSRDEFEKGAIRDAKQTPGVSRAGPELELIADRYQA